MHSRIQATKERPLHHSGFRFPVSRFVAAPCFFLMTLLLAGNIKSVRAQSALDGFNPNADDTIWTVVVQPDGKILLGGSFTTLSPNGVTVARNHIARLNPDGTLDNGFDPNANDTVISIAVQPDGMILVGGSFTTIGGQMRNRIARLDATTGAADSFDPNPHPLVNVNVNAIVVQPDDKILVGGFFSSIGGQVRASMARLDPTTGLADSFDPSANGEILTIALQANGKIVAGGAFTSIGGQKRNYIARVDAITGLADSFDPNSNDQIKSIVVQADGKVLAGGFFHGPKSIGGQSRNYIARLDATTGLADSFDPNANDSVYSVAVQADGKILVAGFFTNIGGQTRNKIARLNATTGAADSFDPNAGPLPWVNTIAVQTDGKILAGGTFSTMGGQTRNRIARLETDGRLDQTVTNLGTVGSWIVAPVLQADGKILIGGNFTSVMGVPRNNIARLNTDGTLDIGFNPSPDSYVLALAVQADGKILVGGSFANIGGQARRDIARLDPTNGLADSFDPSASSTVLSLALQPDGKILAGGLFMIIGGGTYSAMARLDPITGLGDSFVPNPNSAVYTIIVQPDGKILVSGSFDRIGGQERTRIARVDPNTSLPDSFNPIPNNAVTSIALQPDGKVLVGGLFTAISGQDRVNFARLDAVSGFPDSFAPNPNSAVESIVVQADNKILVGGVFTVISGQTRNHLARLDPMTGLTDSFDPSANANVNSIALQPDGKILAGGPFTFIGGQPRSLFARLNNDTAALQHLAVTQSAITWSRAGSSPQFERAIFEYSSDSISYTPLGNGRPSGDNWVLDGLNLPTGHNIYIRARGSYHSGYQDSAENIIEFVQNAFLPGPSATPSPTATATPTSTATATATVTPTATVMHTPSPTPTVTPTPTQTPSPSATPTATATATATATGSPFPTPTPTFEGNFVIGDQNAVIGNHVTFWGAHWAQLNSTSGGSVPNSFKGFANSTDPNPVVCGGGWTASTGNSSGLPSRLPQYIEVVAASSITQLGSTINGNVAMLVVVRTDPGYRPDPGHPGTGTVLSISCVSVPIGNRLSLTTSAHQ